MSLPTVLWHDHEVLLNGPIPKCDCAGRQDEFNHGMLRNMLYQRARYEGGLTDAECEFIREQERLDIVNPKRNPTR